jgi:hypothetical protein
VYRGDEVRQQHLDFVAGRDVGRRDPIICFGVGRSSKTYLNDVDSE